jgi:hypothetical protein
MREDHRKLMAAHPPGRRPRHVDKGAGSKVLP